MAKLGNEPVVVKASSNVYTGLLVAAVLLVAGGLVIMYLRAQVVLENGIL